MKLFLVGLFNDFGIDLADGFLDRRFRDLVAIESTFRIPDDAESEEQAAPPLPKRKEKKAA